MPTLFEKKVYEVTRKIPRGKVSTYAVIARAVGSNGPRAVGNALHRNPFAPKVPCHRVVRSDGAVGGFADGARMKEELLEDEGIRIIDGKVDLLKYSFRLRR
ncbi:MAG: MGMT family protein [Nanoarchaeota archaeon]